MHIFYPTHPSLSNQRNPKPIQLKPHPKPPNSNWP